MDNKKYSISLRIRRVTYEDAYVSVPLNGHITKENEDGSFGIDVDKFVAEARRLGEEAGVEWQIESTEIETHPLQDIKPDSRKSFYPDIDTSEFLQDMSIE